MSWRTRLTRMFLWVAVLAWGIGVGAKLYDLLLPFPLLGRPRQILHTNVALDLGGGPRCPYRRMEDPIRVSRLVVVVCPAHSGRLGLHRGRLLAEQRCVACRRLRRHEWNLKRSGGDTVGTPVGDLRLVAGGNDGRRIRFSCEGDQCSRPHLDGLTLICLISDA